MAHVSYGPYSVICQTVDQYSSTRDAVSFIAILLVIYTVQFAASPFNRPLNEILRHVMLISLIDGESQSRVTG
jgi:hypothetical protein